MVLGRFATDDSFQRMLNVEETSFFKSRTKEQSSQKN